MFGYSLFSALVRPSSLVSCVTFLLCGMGFIVDSSHRSVRLNGLESFCTLLQLVRSLPFKIPLPHFLSHISMFPVLKQNTGPNCMDVDSLTCSGNSEVRMRSERLRKSYLGSNIKLSNENSVTHIFLAKEMSQCEAILSLNSDSILNRRLCCNTTHC